MNCLFYNDTLGMGCPEGGVKKEMPVPLAVPLAMAAGSVVSSIFGGSKAKKAARRAERQAAAEKARVENERRRRMNEDYLDTSAGQNLLRLAREERDKIWRRERGAAAVSGGTDAAAAIAKEQGNKLIGDTVASIAAQDSQRKDSVDASYRGELSRLNQQQIAAQQAKSQAISEAASGASNAMMQGALSTFGGTKLGQSWLGSGTVGGATAPSRLQQMGSDLTILNPSIYRGIQDIEASRRLGYPVQSL